MKHKTEVKTCVWISKATHKRVKEVAVILGMKIQAVADEAIIDGLNSLGKKKL